MASNFPQLSAGRHGSPTLVTAASYPQPYK